MNGPQHYTEAERLMEFADLPHARGNIEADQALKAAQAHATLALAAATIDAARTVATTDPSAFDAGRTITASHIANEADWAEVTA